MLESHNPCIQSVATHALNHANTFLGRNLKYLYDKFNVSVNACSVKRRNTFLSDAKCENVEPLRELVACRDGICYMDNFTMDDINELIRMCSTQDLWIT